MAGLQPGSYEFQMKKDELERAIIRLNVG